MNRWRVEMCDCGTYWRGRHCYKWVVKRPDGSIESIHKTQKVAMTHATQRAAKGRPRAKEREERAARLLRYLTREETQSDFSLVPDGR